MSWNMNSGMFKESEVRAIIKKRDAHKTVKFGGLGGKD